MSDQMRDTIITITVLLAILGGFYLAAFAHHRGKEAERAHEIAIAQYQGCVLLAPDDERLQ